MVKIGINKNPSEKLVQLQLHHPAKLILYHVMQSDCATELESTLHNICKELRMDSTGEWFYLQQSELDGLIGGY